MNIFKKILCFVIVLSSVSTTCFAAENTILLPKKDESHPGSEINNSGTLNHNTQLHAPENKLNCADGTNPCKLPANPPTGVS